MPIVGVIPFSIFLSMELDSNFRDFFKCIMGAAFFIYLLFDLDLDARTHERVVQSIHDSM